MFKVASALLNTSYSSIYSGGTSECTGRKVSLRNRKLNEELNGLYLSVL